MFKINSTAQYALATFILGTVFGCWLSMNFYGELEFMGTDDVYEHDIQYDQEVKVITEQYEKREKERHK